MASARSVTAVVTQETLSNSAALPGHVVGLFIIAFLPTVFWMAVLYAGSWAYGGSLSIWALATIGAVIFSFLVCIWASFAIASRRAT